MLFIASKFGHLNLIKYFVSHGANVNATNNDGFTPLQYASNLIIIKKHTKKINNNKETPIIIKILLNS